MLVVVVSDTKAYRTEQIATVAPNREDVTILDDTLTSITDLEQYLYPSLFTEGASIVHIRFMLEQSFAEMNAGFAKKLIASPTVFIFEEFAVPAPALTSLKKYGALVHASAKVPGPKKGNDMFALASAIITPNKKDAWMNFQRAISYEPVEGLLGIMYWKVRDLMIKNPRTKEQYETLYRNLLQAHAKAWQTNMPLELMIEKVLLQ